MCIGSNSVNQAQDLISVTKFEDFPNSLLPIHEVLRTVGNMLIANMQCLEIIKKWISTTLFILESQHLLKIYVVV